MTNKKLSFDIFVIRTFCFRRFGFHFSLIHFVIHSFGFALFVFNHVQPLLIGQRERSITSKARNNKSECKIGERQKERHGETKKAKTKNMVFRSFCHWHFSLSPHFTIRSFSSIFLFSTVRERSFTKRAEQEERKRKRPKQIRRMTKRRSFIRRKQKMAFRSFCHFRFLLSPLFDFAVFVLLT